MRTSDPVVFAAGDGAFGGSTLVMAMQHGSAPPTTCGTFSRATGTRCPVARPTAPAVKAMLDRRLRLRENPFPQERPACLLGSEWPELRAAPDLALVHDTIAILLRLKKEEMIDIAWFGGARSGTDAAKLVGLGVNALGYGVAVALALGGEITHTGVRFAPDRNEEERAGAVVNILKANAGEASMMAPCAGKTRLHNIEPEDLRSITRATAAATGIPLAGTRAA